jgi:hypothetical protein
MVIIQVYLRRDACRNFVWELASVVNLRREKIKYLVAGGALLANFS